VLPKTRKSKRAAAKRRAEQINAPVAYLNLVGGQDDLVFDGGSFVVSPAGKILAHAHQFVEQTLLVDLTVSDSHSHGRQSGPGVVVVEAGEGHPGRSSRQALTETTPAPQLSINEQIWDALVLGMRDYVEKNGFKSVILGLSGGIDSEVCAAIAVDAIGPHRVFGVSMPSNYSSDHSRSDADDLAERLGIDMRTEAIAPLVEPVETQLNLKDVAAENLQARIRGIILMGLSNAEGHLVLTTGTFAVGEVKTRGQLPVSLRIHAVGQVFGMVISVVKQHIEDRTLKRFLHLTLIARDHACGA
jgi:NAD+ synthase (glutamine-hydrolysing)